MMDNVEKIYSELWNKSLPIFDQGQYETDTLVIDPNDMRRGLTLRAKLSTKLVQEIEPFTAPLKELLPGQYFTPVNDMHLTVLTIISCNTDFKHDPALDVAYGDVILECMINSSPPRITFNGITASPSCLLIKGYPEDDNLEQLRNHLREAFKQSSLPNSVDRCYPLITAHTSIMRFVEPHNKMAEFTRYIRKNQNHAFGNHIIKQIEFVTNDWCHKVANTQVIRTYDFST